VTVPSALADREHARAQIEPIVTERLQAGGYEVVPSAEMETLWRRAADDVDDVFDPITGEVDKERFAAVEAAVHRDLRATRSVDAVLRLRIAAIVLHLTGTSVAYCGSTDDVYWPAGGMSPLERATIVLVLCLNTGLYDLEGRELYGIRHGLEPVETYLRQTRAVRPMDERLRDRQRLVQAVEATLGPLADAGR
jgi:hypothetical protein